MSMSSATLPPATLHAFVTQSVLLPLPIFRDSLPN